ncbi:glycine cleavage system protein GcvH [Natronococcus jeotgali]|uniref:Probable glycine cleavage system H protein n=1 Tax=Natronococcus jeotgali DSM 18795 TaxID=1227498 RepID=L9WTX5_9EURY|nr:glycine cleavage system protein GcvH [Natronococcus jeotgali]ELY51793.1 glycine cleavage system protein H [Natronococcus jeotgali DSM 18795]
MDFEIPTELRYAESHEWADERTDAVRVGVSDFAQDELGDIVFVELPAEGAELGAGEEFGVLESIKAVSDIYAPVAGTVVAANEAVVDSPELVNEDPYGDGWLIEVEPAGDLEHLLDASAYEETI